MDMLTPAALAISDSPDTAPPRSVIVGDVQPAGTGKFLQRRSPAGPVDRLRYGLVTASVLTLRW
ncbi:hypothetical protein GCM10009660_20750 [Catellatospora bangladeshensis]